MGGCRETDGGRLWLCEKAVLGYTALTLVLIGMLWGRLVNPLPMLAGRVAVVVMTLLLWQAYRRWPCKEMAVVRVCAQMLQLIWWYPDTYEFNRLFANFDHVFATWEQVLFGCQPALVCSQWLPQAWISEPLSLGYVSYYPMIATLTIYYFVRQYERFTYGAFVILASFFLFYVVFIALPVAGPQFYYQAVGLDQIAAGVFPDVGHYFMTHQEALPPPGADGPFHELVLLAHAAGERPTAAFPSSHVGVSVVLLWLAREVRAWWLLAILTVLTVLMFFATFYIQAHYAIDAIAGIFVGTAMYFLLRAVYRRLSPFPEAKP